ncbi:MAG: hypothetical protein WCF30_14455 [Terracidiphilus sp.]
MQYRGCGFLHALAFGRRCIAVHSGLALLGGIVALCVALPRPALAQDALPANGILAAPLVASTGHPAKPPVASEITVEGLVSYGNYKIFASGENCKLYDIGIEYDRHSWGHLLGSRVDYVAEFMPTVLLNQPKEMDIWGNTESANRKTVPGIDIAPIGIRWLWRDGKAIKPYVMAKGGALIFAQKPLSSKTTYENMSLQSAIGLEVRMNDHFDLRLALFGDFHFSDGFIVPVNPGLDVMNATMGLTYHLHSKRQIAAH